MKATLRARSPSARSVRISPDLYSTGAVFTSHPVDTGTLMVRVRVRVRARARARVRRKKERARAGVWRAASCREASRRGGRGEATERRGRGVNRLVCVMGVCGRPLWREGVGRG